MNDFEFLDYGDDEDLRIVPDWKQKVENVIRDNHKDKKGVCACAINPSHGLIGFQILKDKDAAKRYLDDYLLRIVVFFIDSTRTHIFVM